MAVDIDSVLKNFAKSIKETETYQRFAYEKNKVSKNPELKAQLDQYRKMIYDFQNNTDENQLFDEVDRMMEISDSIRSNPEANDFLAAELALCRLMQEIYSDLTIELQFDMDLTVLNN
ncbi:MAG: YlbF family regulator [Lachnospiraceae bacterium]|nr:YlbF family regulator [Candidatus Merdinaster equi]